MLKIPYISVDDVDRWEEGCKNMLPIIDKWIDKGEIQRGYRLHLKYCEYINLAIIAYARDDIERCKKLFEKSLKPYKDFLNRYSIGEDIDDGYLWYSDYKAMLIALIIDDLVIAREIAKLYGTYPAHNEDADYYSYYGNAIKYGILGKTDRACKSLKIAQAFLKSPKNTYLPYYHHLIEMADSVICGAGEINNKLWESALNEFSLYAKKEEAGMPNAVIFFDGIGLIALNKLIHGKSFVPRIKDDRALLISGLG